ncbi:MULTISPECIES: 7-cyano-7-deazaguanine synthase QueC [unclassified Neptuniibacter]|uniref:7-cyano-7-deazaguanine synthase QueC n=1 Tax=unclassified Neptuniibacter TaxID=2630693 RepID=UPI0025F64F8F|nr:MULTISPECIES: 7-cyano-7-deazaguanine synthase QueC [unclassified Neptuniibacter]|tara:strand:+ start:9568 stop:10251 length:684 start_codon:yes stop_codon:yes gene_type:complete
MNTPASPKAVVLLSGGLDSATALAMASDRGYDCYVLSFDYGQRSLTELNAAKEIAKQQGAVEHRVIRLHLEDFGGSALTDHSIDVPEEETEDIPVTYVPARNTVFLSLALGWAEVLEADAIFIGVNAVDYSGYPDCRPEYITAFETMANLATKRGVSGDPITIETPLIDLTKEEIILAGTKLNVDYGLTVSCYQADDNGKACGACDSCRLRAKGFENAGLKDPTKYQ